MSDPFPSRRSWLKTTAGGLGWSLSGFLGLSTLGHRPAFGSPRIEPSVRPVTQAKSCIVLFCWGGMSHLDTWDMKPDGPREIRGEFQPVQTTVPGIQLSEHIPHLAGQIDKLAVIRSIHHGSSAHGKGMYWNLTGHAPTNEGVAANQPPTAEDWPSLGSMISNFRQAPAGFPAAVRLPYPLVDNQTLQAGEYGGWMGQTYDPIVIRTPGGTPFGGVSRSLGASELVLENEVDVDRIENRASLLGKLGRSLPEMKAIEHHDFFRQMAMDMLANPEVKQSFAIDDEPAEIREAYGDHICGRSILLARRLSEAGVPLVTVCCAAGDLNGSVGDHWDTHGDNFGRLKNTMLPTFDRPAAFLIEDLARSGRLDETLVVILTEFGRTPQINGGAGRDHFPNCYSVALAGGGIAGGQVYGSSDSTGAEPKSAPCTPADLHATIFRSMGIPVDAVLHDQLGRPFQITDGQPLPLFG